VSCIDALARLQSNSTVGDRFCIWVEDELPSFDGKISRPFYDEFRNGLVHEARIKNGGRFAVDQPTTIDLTVGILSINPTLLADEVTCALSKYLAALKGQSKACQHLIVKLKTEFQYELTL
jgi:hypothetical protein